MSRVMVHLFDNTEKASDVGRRCGRPLILVIDSRGIAEGGCSFYMSGDGVYLTRTVPVRFMRPVLRPEVE